MPPDRPKPNAEALLEHAAFVRALARHLVRDAADVDDAVQETWRTALERPPRSRDTARAWLAAVLRNRVRQDHRGRTRRVAREVAVARPEGIESAASTVARREVERRIAEAVLALAEPFRTTILLRYYEDEPPRRIARRMDVPVETVKSRLKRGRAHLRAALADRHADWRLGLVPAFDAVAAGSAPTGMGVMLMGFKTKLLASLACALLLATLGWHVLGDPTPLAGDGTKAGATGPAPPEGAPAGAVTNAEAPGLRTLGTRRQGAGEARVAVPPPARADRPAQAPGDPRAEHTGRVRGIVTVDGRPAAGGRVLVGVGSGGPATIAEDGSFEVTGLPPGVGTTLRVEVGGRQLRAVRVRPTAQGEGRVRIVFGTARIHGRVLDEEGRTRAGAKVRLSTFAVQDGDGRWTTSADGTRFHIETSTDAEGRYAFRDLPQGTYILVGELATAARSKARDIRSFRVTLQTGEVREVDLGEEVQEGRWVGRVQYAGGERPRASGSIFLVHQDGSRRMYVKFDSEGRIDAQVPTGTWRMEYVFSVAGRFGAMGAFRVVPTTQELTIESGEVRVDPIVPGARVEGRVRGAGTPDPTVRPTVTFTPQDPPPEGPKPLITTLGKPVTAVLAADGTYFVEGLAPGRYVVTAAPKELAREVEFEVEGGHGSLPLDLVLAP